MITERNIIIGFITSTEFHQQMKDHWNVNLFESSMAKRIATWCKEYFDKYQKAPQKAIEPIFFDKVKNGLPKDIAEEIEDDILPSLSREYLENPINLEYLVTESKQYFHMRSMYKHSETIRALLDTGKLKEAEELCNGFTPLAKDMNSWIEFTDPEVLFQKVHEAFTHASERLFNFPGALGEIFNHQLVRGGFVAFMGPEKRGKTFLLLEIIMRALREGRNVAFFQAGDMSELEQIMRISIYVAKKSNLEEYAGEMYEPVKDCVKNQLNTCDKKCRECRFGVFSKKREDTWRREVTKQDLMEALADNPEYKPCKNCESVDKHGFGTVWLQKVDVGEALTEDEALVHYENFLRKYKGRLKISTHATSTLTVEESNAIMDVWEKEDDFIADVIVYDYPDIMEDKEGEFRHKQNQIWKKLRGTSQKRNALVVTVTQADADSYTKDTIGKKNFSEDKRKYGHVTAFYGLNQDPNGREKELGIMRINEIVVREGDFSQKRQVSVLQNLRRGRPFITSFW